MVTTWVTPKVVYYPDAFQSHIPRTMCVASLTALLALGLGCCCRQALIRDLALTYVLRFARGFAWDESSIFRAAWVCFRLLNYSSLTSFFFQMRFEGFGDQLGIGDLLVEPCLLGPQSL